MAYQMKDFSCRIKLSTMRNIVELYRVEMAGVKRCRRKPFDVFCRQLLDESVTERLEACRVKSAEVAASARAGLPH